MAKKNHRKKYEKVIGDEVPKLLSIIYNKYKVYSRNKKNEDGWVAISPPEEMNDRKYFTTRAHHQYVNKFRNALHHVISSYKDFLVPSHNYLEFPMLRDGQNSVVFMQLTTKTCFDTFKDVVAMIDTDYFTIQKMQIELNVLWNILCSAMKWEEEKAKIVSNRKDRMDQEEAGRMQKKLAEQREKQREEKKEKRKRKRGSSSGVLSGGERKRRRRGEEEKGKEKELEMFEGVIVLSSSDEDDEDEWNES